jgi:hypothetical protein
MNEREQNNKRRMAFNLLMAGYDSDTIAQELGCQDGQEVTALVETHLSTLPQESIQEQFLLEAYRLEVLQSVIWPLAIAREGVRPDVQLRAIDVVIRFMKRRAWLLGLDEHPVRKARDRKRFKVEWGGYAPLERELKRKGRKI